MNFSFQQLEYLVAVDTHRHFVRAAAACFVTQPTLSMMIQKMEQNLGVQIFDRSQHPVIPTSIGVEIIDQAKAILSKANALQQIIQDRQDQISGKIQIGIIPTLAPYLLPRFVSEFVKQYPQVDLYLHEYLTPKIIELLKEGKLDMGIMATPIQDPKLIERPLFYERFFLYSGQTDRSIVKRKILPEDIDLEQLWLLEAGHCMRSQVVNFCEMKQQKLPLTGLHYEAGSLETLIRMVDRQHGLTIIPELCTFDLTEVQKLQIKSFENPVPVREISIVYTETFYKKRALEALYQCIIAHLPQEITQIGNKRVIPVVETISFE